MHRLTLSNIEVFYLKKNVQSFQAALFIRKVLKSLFIFIEGFRFFCSVTLIIPQNVTLDLTENG